MKTLILTELGHGYVKIALCYKNKQNKDSGHAFIHAKETFSAPINDGEIIDHDETVRIFTDYIKKYKATKCGVRIVLHHPKAIMRYDVLPKMRGSELDKALKQRLPGMFPKTDEYSVYDYRTCELGNGAMGITAVRLPMSVSLDIVGFFRGLGLKPVSLDTFTNASSVYLERHYKHNFAAIYEHSNSISVVGFLSGKPNSFREILFSDQNYAITEVKKYLRTITNLEEIFILTNRGIIENFNAGALENEYAALYGVF